jgi:hypothetical protein
VYYFKKYLNEILIPFMKSERDAAALRAGWDTATKGLMPPLFYLDGEGEQ